jgi:hypothetical protein
MLLFCHPATPARSPEGQEHQGVLSEKRSLSALKGDQTTRCKAMTAAIGTSEPSRECGLGETPSLLQYHF